MILSEFLAIGTPDRVNQAENSFHLITLKSVSIVIFMDEKPLAESPPYISSVDRLQDRLGASWSHLQMAKSSSSGARSSLESALKRIHQF